MYIRITKNSRGDAYYHLVESFRHEGKVRQRVLLSLGRVEEGKLGQLAEAISKHLDRITALNLADSIDISRFTFVNEEPAWYETRNDQDRYIVTWSEVRAERDRKTREDILDTIRQKLSKKKLSDKEFITNSNYKKYVSIDGKDKPVLNREAIEKESKRDRFFGIIANVKKD